jgi:hypothetical protein
MQSSSVSWRIGLVRISLLQVPYEISGTYIYSTLTLEKLRRNRPLLLFVLYPSHGDRITSNHMAILSVVVPQIPCTYFHKVSATWHGNTDAVDIKSNRATEVAHTNKNSYKFRNEDRYSVKRESCFGPELLEMRWGERIEGAVLGDSWREKGQPHGFYKRKVTWWE